MWYETDVMLGRALESLPPFGAMPDYVWIPWQCKRPALDYAHSIQATQDVKHVIYIGDSILRTSFCGHLYPQLHDGEVGGDCTFLDDAKVYHFSNKNFTYNAALPNSRDSRSVRFSEGFIDSSPRNSWWYRVSKLGGGDGIDRSQGTESELDTIPASHVIMNIGMWYADREVEEYQREMLFLLHKVYDNYGGKDVRIMWLMSTSVSPGAACYRNMKRRGLRRHSDWAKGGIRMFKEVHPDAKIMTVDPYVLMDNRPETTSDGR
jgi:hypothetical protein